MPLIKCSECGRAISTEAEACPQCGHPPTVDTSAVGTSVLRMFGDSDHKVPKPRRTESCAASPKHLRLVRPRRRVRTAVPKLLLGRRGMEDLWVDHIGGNRPGFHCLGVHLVQMREYWRGHAG